MVKSQKQPTGGAFLGFLLFDISIITCQNVNALRILLVLEMGKIKIYNGNVYKIM